ncbi:MAG: Rrf2 family transcriptional regulator [Vallitalea sp.]|jgi:Rrf2 family protein|nr:Rrf2 family transcriptional regulator [Vallitalea sp.]
MNISNKSRYGLRAIIYLGINYEKENVSIGEISQKEGISKRYLEQIFSQLKKGGVINSIKGTKGGYFLAKNPSKITVGNVLRLLEGDLNIIENDKNYSIEDIEYTVINKVWNNMTNAVLEVVDNITIKDIINDYNNLCQGMFYI